MKTEIFNQQKIIEKLSHLSLGNIEFHQTIGSTNDRAAELAIENAAQFSVVIADEQTKGRGRSGRNWFTPPGSALAFSLVLRPNQEIISSGVALMSGLGALAVSQGIKEFTGVDASIKWPNDVLIKRKKICGILAEAQWVGERLQSLVLGIGINISKYSVPKEEDLNFPATSLNQAVKGNHNRLDILEAVLKQIIKLWPIVGKPEFINAWASLLEYRDEKVLLNSGKDIAITGVVKGLTEDGSLVLSSELGQERSFKFGEIQLRPNING